ncbi:hypothetical protein NJB18001_42070 [Mycobacterium marinum]|uniref:alpha/beta fold hydrolase n=1 Tax=Mycobacterium marinum TaxID=1781 RepID=UPI000EE93EBB|nr:hypothetical protein [Mycobacterium marinum]RFZ33078.1 hypothetical protein KST_04370 [Mycobacterium marinum]GJP11000.1 hypothetical protein NJB18001_42070 [Mycobacterium marinum]
MPTLVLAFDHDLFFPPALCEATARLIPTAEFAQIDGAGHGGIFTGPRDSVARTAEFCSGYRANYSSGGCPRINSGPVHSPSHSWSCMNASGIFTR